MVTSPLGFKRISPVTIMYLLYSVIQRCDRNRVIFYLSTENKGSDFCVVYGNRVLSCLSHLHKAVIRLDIGIASPPPVAQPPIPVNSITVLRHSLERLKMREIVHLQAGQCGNQIGAKVCMRRERVILSYFIRIYFYSRPILLAFLYHFRSPPNYRFWVWYQQPEQLNGHCFGAVKTIVVNI